MKIAVEPYGILPDGRQVSRYSLENNSGMQVDILDYGAVILSILVPDKNGQVDDVTLGHAGMAQYIENPGAFGAAVGRNSNRIENARVKVSGKWYELEKNNGEHNLHSGTGSLIRRLFTAQVRSLGLTPTLLLSHTVESMGDGFPGNLTVNIAYALTDDNALMIDYQAVCDDNTVINLTNHSYFNLAGHGSGSVNDHILQLNAPFFAAHRPDGIPTGELLAVEGTPFDFRMGARLGDAADSAHPQVTQFGGFDHNLVLEGGGYRLCGKVTEPVSGRVMELFTDLPCVQLYTANKLSPESPCKSGAVYGARQGLCLETQLFPNAVHMPWLTSPYFSAGEEFTSTTTYRFSVER